MDVAIANKVVDFIFSASGRYSIICGLDGVIIAAKVSTRVGDLHPGSRKMLQEGLSEAMITVEQEEASAGTMKAGCNLPILHNGEVVGSIGITGDPERTEPVARLASGLISKELREKEMHELLLGHAAQMEQSVAEIAAIVEKADASQLKVAAEVGEVEQLVQASFDDITKTDEVIDTIQSIASNTQMLGLNASIEAAHAREHGRGFSIVAEAVRKLSVQCGDAAESVKVTQTHLHESMSHVVVFSKDLMANTLEQTKATGALARKVAELKSVSEGLLAMTRA